MNKKNTKAENHIADLTYRFQCYQSTFAIAGIDNYDAADIDQFTGFSINDLHSTFNIPIHTVRNDIAMLCKASDFTYLIPLSDDDIQESWYEKNIADLKNGVYDDIKFYVPSLINRYNISIPFTEREIEALSDYVTNELGKTNRALFLKDSYRTSVYNEHFFSNILTVSRIIQAQAAVSFKYIDSRNDLLNIQIYPLRIIYDATQNIYSILSIGKDGVDTYHFSRIKGKISPCRQPGENTIRPSQDDIDRCLDKICQVWGLQFRVDQPTHVKLRILNRYNCVERAEKELLCRTKGILSRNRDGDLIYEDDIYGTAPFISWVMTFGQNAELFEPSDMREQIIRRWMGLYERCKKLYI